MPLTTNKIVVAMFGMAAGGYKSTIDSYLQANGELKTVEALLPFSGLNPTFLGSQLYNNQQFADALVAKMLPGLSSVVASATSALIVNYMAANPTKSRAQVVLDLINALDAIPYTDPTFGAVSQAYDNKVALADAYTGTSTDWNDLAVVVGNQPTQNVGQTFTLTTGTDTADQTGSSKAGMDTSASFKFTNANDKVTAAAGTLNSTDVLLDPSTSDNDVLEANIVFSTTLANPTIQNIETFKLNLLANGAGLDFANVLGVKTVEITGSGNGVLANVAATAPEVTLTGGYDKTPTLAFDTLAGTSSSNPESLKVNLNGAGSKAAVQINIEGTSTSNTGSLEQLTINSAGTAANTLTVGTTDFDGTGNGYASANGISKFTVTGSQDLTLKVAHDVITGKELAKTGTGKLTLELDRVVGTSAATTQITHLANVSGYDRLVVTDSKNGADLNIVNILSGSTVELKGGFTGTGADTLTVKNAGTGTNDSLKLVLNNSGTGINLSKELAIEDVETVEIESAGGGANTIGSTA
ncbi:MAG: hypothetical protein N2441_06440, partial [Rhodocyclaceae bacterium]|nr:hypothetical protein [Rhodocyclaceae bacterium]